MRDKVIMMTRDFPFVFILFHGYFLIVFFENKTTTSYIKGFNGAHHVHSILLQWLHFRQNL